MATNDYDSMAMAHAYRAGVTLAEIGRQHHCSANTVSRHLHRTGVELRTRDLSRATLPDPESEQILGVERCDLAASAHLLKIRRAAK